MIFVVPFVEEWPYQTSFTLEHLQAVLNDNSLTMVYRNSIFVAVLTAVLGLFITYGAALVTARSNMKHRWKGIINSIALITNTIPGMIIGIAYMLIFSGTPSLQRGTLLLHTLSDDEKLPGKTEQLLGNHCISYG